MKRKIIIDASLEVEVDGVEYYVECTIQGTCYYEPAILGGPPEDCSPEESECDLESIKVDHAEDLLNAEEVKDPELLKKIELAIDEDWAIDCLWEEYDVMRQAEEDGE